MGVVPTMGHSQRQYFAVFFASFFSLLILLLRWIDLTCIRWIDLTCIGYIWINVDTLWAISDWKKVPLNKIPLKIQLTIDNFATAYRCRDISPFFQSTKYRYFSSNRPQKPITRSHLSISIELIRARSRKCNSAQRSIISFLQWIWPTGK